MPRYWTPCGSRARTAAAPGTGIAAMLLRHIISSGLAAVQRSAGLCGGAGSCWQHGGMAAEGRHRSLPATVPPLFPGSLECSQAVWRRFKSGQQHRVGRVCRQDLVQAKQGIGELFGRVADIKRKAEASEAMVQVCRRRSAVARTLPSCTAPERQFCSPQCLAHTRFRCTA